MVRQSFLIQEVNVDAVSVMSGTNWRDRFKGTARFSPRVAPGHGRGVVDQEDGVEGREEGVGVVNSRREGRGGAGALFGGEGGGGQVVGVGLIVCVGVSWRRAGWGSIGDCGDIGAGWWRVSMIVHVYDCVYLVMERTTTDLSWCSSIAIVALLTTGGTR